MSIKSGSGDQNDSAKQLGKALKRFCRSIELCDDYLRGYYGLKLVRCCNFPYQPSKAVGLTSSKDNNTTSQ